MLIPGWIITIGRTYCIKDLCCTKGVSIISLFGRTGNLLVTMPFFLANSTPLSTHPLS